MVSVSLDVLNSDRITAGSIRIKDSSIVCAHDEVVGASKREIQRLRCRLINIVTLLQNKQLVQQVPRSIRQNSHSPVSRVCDGLEGEICVKIAPNCLCV
jgi:hypothetical protein